MYDRMQSLYAKCLFENFQTPTVYSDILHMYIVQIVETQEGLTGHLRPQKCCPTWQLNNVKETQQASYVSQLFADLSLKLIFCRSKFLIRSL